MNQVKCARELPATSEDVLKYFQESRPAKILYVESFEIVYGGILQDMDRDFYLGMFKKNDFIVAQDRLYKEKQPWGMAVAKYGRVFKCPITFFRVVDRLGMGRGPRVQIIRGGLKQKFIVARITSAYRLPLSLNIYVGCENKLTTQKKTTTTTTTTTPMPAASSTTAGKKEKTTLADSGTKAKEEADVTTGSAADKATDGEKNTASMTAETKTVTTLKAE